MSLEISPKLGRHTVQELIRAAEIRNGGRLPAEDFEFLTTSIIEFTQQAIDKFVRGSVEHGGCFVEDIEPRQEIQNEILDLWFYHNADKRKQNSK